MLITMPRTLDYTREVAQRNPSPFSPPKYTKGTICNSVPVSRMSNDELAEYSMKRLSLVEHVVNGTATVNAHCTKCGSTFIFKVSSPDNPTDPTNQTHHKPLTYCPYCATPTLAVTVEPYGAWDALAEVYNLSVMAVKAYYKFWTQYSNTPTFALFMEQIPAQLEREITQAKTRANNTNQTNAKRTPPPSKLRKTIRLRVVGAPKTAIPQYANTPPMPPQSDTITNSSLKHIICESCGECELSVYSTWSNDVGNKTCEPCKINYLTLHTTFTHNGGC